MVERGSCVQRWGGHGQAMGQVVNVVMVPWYSGCIIVNVGLH